MELAVIFQLHFWMVEELDFENVRNWQMTADSHTREQYLNLFRLDFW